MKMNRLLTLCAAGLLAVASLTGCGGQQAASSSGSGEKVLKVGTNADFAPFEFQDEAGSSDYQGFDMDLIRAIGKEMGYKVEIQNLGFDGLVPAVATKNIDAAISGMTINDERKEKVAFSAPYYDSGLTVVVKKENQSINSFNDLKGKKVAVQIGTTSAKEVKKIEGVEVKEFNSSADTFMELKAGGVDAVVNDRPVNEYYIKKSGETDVRELADRLTSEQYGIALAKDDADLKAKIDEALQKLKDSGEYDKIFEKWFGKAE
jgi:polar amino acid transport system substrate-binding protein